MLTKFTQKAIAATAVLAVSGLSVMAQNSIRSYSLIYSENLKGGCAMIGNTSMHILRNNGSVNTTQMNEISNANNGQGGVGYTQYGNDQSNMQFARIDNATTGIYNATSADLILPAGNNTIKYARLYWGGRILTSALNTAADTLQRVKIRKGNSGNYFNVIAPASNVDFFNVTATERIYQSYVDVTAFINSNGAGTYTVANVPSTAGSVGNGGRFAGWCLVVAYENQTLNYNSVRIYDGYAQIFDNGTTTVSQTVDLTGLNVPNNPLTADEAVMQTMAWEGDGNLGATASNPLGDYLEVNSTAVSNTANIATNFWNGSITKNGAYVTTKNPNYSNQMGIDIDEVSVGVGYNIQPNATSVQVKFGTEADQYFPSVFTFAIRMKEPVISLDKAVSDANNNGFVDANEILTYTISGTNQGPGAAYNVAIVDSLPLNVAYVDGSLEVVNAAGVTAGFKTDAQDGDEAFVGVAGNGRKYVKFFIGNGATGSSGGTLPFGANGSYTLRLKVKAGAIPGSVVNTARILATSQAGESFTDDGTAVIGEAGGPVPVKLFSFAVMKSNNNGLVKWVTDIEENSDFFQIERSDDGIHFASRGKVTAQGNSNTRHTYDYTDALNSRSSIVYYRLKMVDKDGKYSYSKIVALKLDGSLKLSDFSVYPNPFVSDVKINLNTTINETATIRVLSLDGKAMMTRTALLQTGDNILVIKDLNALARGTYVLEVITESNKYVQKLIKN
jgi:uncharacterized repeat protein (TIGR01451 family)